jgi:4'-phosphopantetheinyl transferase
VTATASVAEAVGSPVPALVRGACQVWWAALDDVGPGHDALLSPGDLDRRSRLLRAADRRRLTAAAAVAGLVLGAHAGRPPARLDIDRTCPHCGRPHGKPRIADLPDLHFSVSHSADRVVVAVSRDGPVGVDVEEVGSWDAADLDEVAMLTLAPEERAVLYRAPKGARAAVFTAYWTRKEAAVKATGAGLTTALEDILVSPPASAPRVLRWGDAAAGPPPVLHVLRAPAGYAAALALVGPTTRVMEADAGPFLQTAFPSQTRRRLSSATTRSQR